MGGSENRWTRVPRVHVALSRAVGPDVRQYTDVSLAAVRIFHSPNWQYGYIRSNGNSQSRTAEETPQGLYGLPRILPRFFLHISLLVSLFNPPLPIYS